MACSGGTTKVTMPPGSMRAAPDAAAPNSFVRILRLLLLGQDSAANAPASRRVTQAAQAAMSSSAAAAPSSIAPATTFSAAAHARSWSGRQAGPATSAIEAISTVATTG